MPRENPLSKCGFEECDHYRVVHLETRDGDTVTWPCTLNDCDCHDFAQPGSVEEVTVEE